MKYVLALDQGTTSTRAIIFDKKGSIVGLAQKEFIQIYPAVGYVEHNPEDIVNSSICVINESLKQAGLIIGDLAAIGITNQRETTIVWDRTTGEPVSNAIVWQCRRTADIAQQLKKEGLSERIYQKTGLVPDAYFSATKIKWILDNVEGAREKAERGELLFGTVDTFLMWRFSCGRIFATDPTNASRTMLFNIHTLQWDYELMKWIVISLLST
ncbi:MAG: glycerol kinase, partial [Clostridia bacterium]|nr:glycerol kinase [Clostridia bacterium]